MREKLINCDLLEEIRTSRDTSTWQDRNDHNIVDLGYTHKYLLANRTVDKIIKEFYFKPFRKIYTTDEWRELINADMHNKIDITNHCSYLIEGALHNKVNLYLKINALLELKDQHILNHKYEYFSDLKPYFTSYAKDFKSGYNQFLNVIVKPFLFFENNKEQASDIIFRYITNNQSNDPVVFLGRGFKMRSENDVYEIDYDFLDGLHEGYLYRAWTIIFSQNELFLPLFKKYLNGENIRDTDKTKLIKEDVLKMQNNLIPRISLEYVYDFFKVLIEPNKKGTFYLNEQKLLIFIESTFVNKKSIQQSFNVPFSKDKKDIRSVFKKFLDNCSELEFHKKNLKSKYFDIMNNAFIGFNDKYSFDKWADTNNEIPTLSKPKGNYLVGKGNV
jgi:hypothetical protein